MTILAGAEVPERGEAVIVSGEPTRAACSRAVPADVVAEHLGLDRQVLDGQVDGDPAGVALEVGEVGAGTLGGPLGGEHPHREIAPRPAARTPAEPRHPRRRRCARPEPPTPVVPSGDIDTATDCSTRLLVLSTSACAVGATEALTSTAETATDVVATNFLTT